MAVICDRDSNWRRNGSLFPQLYGWTITEQLRGAVMVGGCVCASAGTKERERGVVECICDIFYRLDSQMDLLNKNFALVGE